MTSVDPIEIMLSEIFDKVFYNKHQGPRYVNTATELGGLRLSSFDHKTLTGTLDIWILNVWTVRSAVALDLWRKNNDGRR